MSDMKNVQHVFTDCRVFDKTKPEGKQDVAMLYLAGQYIGFMCQHDKNGINFLNKQHAVEFATMMLAMALQIKGDIPDGDITWGVPTAIPEEVVP